jgi:hypothetical protein
MLDSPQPQPRPPGRRRTRWLIGLGVVALALGAGYGWRTLWHRSLRPTTPVDAPIAAADADPRLSLNSPYRNVAPDVQYVGDEVCARCHRSYAETYRHHPMGRSLAPIADPAVEPDHIRRAVSPFDALGLQFQVVRQGDQVIHREVAFDANRQPLAQTEEAVRYVIGSGNHAISYFIQHDGILTLAPITWYTQKNGWDVSPGFNTGATRFERPIAAGCLFCHTNRVDPEPDTTNSFRQPIFHGYAIGCERCHGPGALHTQARENFREADDPDLTIVNPGRLTPALRDSVCDQCHLGGRDRVVRRGRGVFDFRPGLPLEAFLRVFVTPRETVQTSRVAGHAEQMRDSRCFQQSGGRLGCISCHDPHALPKPEDRDTYYRDRCLQCHQPQSCSVPLARRHETTRTDACTVCHMAAEETNIEHMALTDHRIPRRPESGGRTPVNPATLGAARFIVPFGHDAVDLTDPELARDWAITLMGQSRLRPTAFQQEASRLCVPVLERAVTTHPDDLDARDALAFALAWVGQMERANAVLDDTLQRAPRRESALVDAALLTQRMGLLDLSLGYWQRARAINPWSAPYRFNAAQVMAQRGDVAKAVTECQQILAQNAGDFGSRFFLMRQYLQAGQRAQARRELEILLAYHPPAEAELRKTYGELLR